MSNEILSHFWRWWVDLVGGLGLPWDRQTTAYFALALAFYAIGLAFKVLTAKEK